MLTKIHEHGFIELIEVMGNDDAIVRAAAVSFGKDKATKAPEVKRSLIRYLMRQRHTTPFEMVEFKFHMSMSIMEARQFIRHRTANVNEFSQRYSEVPDNFYAPKPERLRKQSTSNKQGSSDELIEDAEQHALDFTGEAESAFVLYQKRLDAGMSKEMARLNLPLSTYTRWYWKIDLHNLFHFLSLRMDPHAQEEIRLYANAMAEMVQAHCPVAYEAFVDYRLHAVTFSRMEMERLREILETYGEDHAIANPAGIGEREVAEWRKKTGL